MFTWPQTASYTGNTSEQVPSCKIQLTSPSSTASQPRSSRYSRPPGTQSGREHAGTSGGSTRACFWTGCCQQHLTRGKCILLQGAKETRTEISHVIETALASINNSPWDAHEDIDICLLLTSLHFLIMTVIITQVGTVVATFRCLNHRSRLHPFPQLCYASLLATLAFVTSECGDREVHRVVEEFWQNHSRVRQCCLFFRNRSLPRRLRVRSFIMVRWHFSARHNSTSTALLPGDACAGDSTQWRSRGH